MVNPKMQTDVYILTGNTEASVTSEKRIPRKKNNVKSLKILPPRNDPIPNQDINMLGAEKYQYLPTQLAKFCTGYKSLINEAEDGRNDSTDTSRTDKKYPVKNLKSINNRNIAD